jgi:type II secretory pathway pseudopilin PulG
VTPRPCTLPAARTTLHKEAVVELARTDARASGSGGAGLFNVVSVVILVFAVLIIGIAAALLARTLAAAQSIDKKAQTISGNASNINVATDTLVQLNRTNEVAASILQNTKPLEGQLTTVDTVARDIDGLAKSINGTAGSINGYAGTINGTAVTINGTARDINTNAGTINSTAGTINATARGINTQASLILDVAKRIDADAVTINQTIARTIVIAQNIKIDTGNINNQAIRAELTSRCINAKVRLNLIAPPQPPC